MKNYIALLLSCAFICTQAMMEEENPYLYIPIINKSGTKIDATLIELTPDLSLYDIQDMLRQKKGPGNLVVGSGSTIGERGMYLGLSWDLRKYVLDAERIPSVKEDLKKTNFRFILNQ